MSVEAPAAEVRLDGVVASYRRGLRRRYEVLRGASLTAAPGEITAIVGPNGAGKTTLFSVLLGFLRPDRGSATIAGMDPADYRSRWGIGYLPETACFPAGWKARDILARAADLSCAPERRAAAFAEAVERAALPPETLAKPIRSCSKGTQRRVSIAWALAGDPQLLVLDEPFSGLDPGSRVLLRRQVRAARDRGAAILMASHNLDEVGRLTDAALILERGRLRPAGASGSGELSLAGALESELAPEGAR